MPLLIFIMYTIGIVHVNAIIMSMATAASNLLVISIRYGSKVYNLQLRIHLYVLSIIYLYIYTYFMYFHLVSPTEM